MQHHIPFEEEIIKFEFPPIFSIDKSIHDNPVQHLLQKQSVKEVNISGYTENRVRGYILKPVEHDEILAIYNSAQIPSGFAKVLRINELDFTASSEAIRLDESNAKWEKHPKLLESISEEINPTEILSSWKRAFTFKEEDLENDIKGLRKPQIGAVHAVHAHWTVSTEAATIVMPTGTGKTETMLSVLVSFECEKLMIVVPTDALRTQIYNKFLGLGILKDFGIIDQSISYPVACLLQHKPQSVKEVDEIFEKCNVIVSTMSLAGQCSSNIQKRMAYHCPYLFIDEAHHLGATTWKRFKEKFSSSRILQFTATPYRNDGKPVEGKPIFEYPLKQAQEDGYFKKIKFIPVKEFNPKLRDRAIAETAIQKLREDIKSGLDHILMARVQTVKRAGEILAIYNEFDEVKPVQIHSQMTVSQRNSATKKILSRESRIIVCVDMLGEGFDLPELKIAAFHDIRKSLPVTLQLAGRFTRASQELGDPTFIANIADTFVTEEIKKLYQQNSDWNYLLEQASTRAIEEEFDLWEFINGFQHFPEEISLQNVNPAMSSVVYKTNCDNWEPLNYEKGITGFKSLDKVYTDYNPDKNTIVVLSTKKVNIPWAKIDDIYTLEWELYIMYWNQEKELLFIHGSNNSGTYKSLAKAIAVNDVELIKGPQIFKSLSGVNRIKFQNVGLIEQFGKWIRFTMRAGSDIEQGLSEAQKQNVRKSNLFGAGFEHGRKTTIGCSFKGRIWSYKRTNLNEFTEWCDNLGKKLLDTSIDPDDFLKGTLHEELISERPKKMPIRIDWPGNMYSEIETAYEFIQDSNNSAPFYLADISLIDPKETGDIQFQVETEDFDLQFTLRLYEENETPKFSIAEINTDNPSFIGAKGSRIPTAEFFEEHPPVIWFFDSSSLEDGNNYVQIGKDYQPYPKEKIAVWEWDDVDITKESQGIQKRQDSVQFRVIEKLKASSCNIIFDDDGNGEAADVVAINSNEDSISVVFYHCKYSSKPEKGARISDLYEVCGQAQKSIHWKEKMPQLFEHLLRRESLRKKKHEVSRIVRGDEDELLKLREMSLSLRTDLKIVIVQPGLSKDQVSTSQLELLSVTENYLMETYELPFEVIAST